MAGREKMTAVILAGGRGTRLKPVVPDGPKVLAPVGGRPFLTYVLDELAAGGFSRVVLCTGTEGDRVRALLGETYQGLTLAYAQEREPLGTAGALFRALPQLSCEPVLVLNGDSFCLLDWESFCGWHQSCRARGTLALARVEDARRYGRVNMDGDGQITRFAEKSCAAGPGWVSAGVYLLSRALLHSIPPEKPVSLEEEIFPGWVEKGLYGYCTLGPFLDIGTPDGYRAAREFFAGREA